MAVVVKKHRVRTGEKVYLPGAVITDLKPKVEKELVDDGYCDYVEKKLNEPQEQEGNNGESNGPITGYPNRGKGK
jgi:hypothetical protein